MIEPIDDLVECPVCGYDQLHLTQHRLIPIHKVRRVKPDGVYMTQVWCEGVGLLPAPTREVIRG